MRRSDAADAIAGEQQRDQHGDQRRALQHVGQEHRHPGGARHRFGAGHHDGQEDRRRHDAERVQPRQHGDDDAAVAEAGRQVAHHLEVHAADLADAGQPGEPAGDQRGDDDDLADGDAAIARGLGVLAGDADLEAERGAGDEEPDEPGRDEGGEHAEMQARAFDQLGEAGRILDRRRDRIAAERVLPRPFDQRHDGEIDDRVEEQRAHHVVDLEVDAEQRRDQRDQPAGRRAGERHREHGERAGHRVGADEGSGDGARHQLALGADVPEFCAEGDGDGQAREDHGRCLDQRLGDVELRAQRAAEHDAIGLENAGARQRDQPAAQDGALRQSRPAASDGSARRAVVGAGARVFTHGRSLTPPP